MRHLSTYGGIIVALSTGGLWSCASQPAVEPEAPAELAFVPLTPLANQDFRIVDMAAAHGALTVELEVAAGTDVETIAREVIEPVQSRYAEILVYLYDRDQSSLLPLRRVRWTPAGGYEMLSYQSP